MIFAFLFAWYGLPKSRGQFTDGSRGFGTVCHICYRITGEHTLEMIRSFSDFEYREVNGQRKPLLEKKSDGTGVIRNKVTAISEDDGSGAALSRYGIYVKCDHGHYLKPDEI